MRGVLETQGEEFKGGQPVAWARGCQKGLCRAGGYPQGFLQPRVFPLHPESQRTWWQILLGEPFPCLFSPVLLDALTPWVVQISCSPVGAPADASGSKD